ncbi:MAG TPA: hypothetical protein VE398_12800 [Acidobacteriota bacterium]|nr:hypothetical protein [Acidobacteriota bacterium]
MSLRRGISAAGIIVACASSLCFGAAAMSGTQPARSEGPRPANATPCALTVPIRISLTPLNEPGAGGTARFSVSVESGVDPDLVRRMWIEYEIPERMRRGRESPANRELPRTAAKNRDEFNVGIPDQGRYAIRARLMVELTDGNTISRTATRWINLGNTAPDGMIGRITDPDGTGIRVYQGDTERH